MQRFINLDMDGVVADFNTYVGGILKRQIGWEGKDLSDQEWDTLTKVDRLYYNLPLIRESVELVLLARQLAMRNNLGLRFLTAVPRTTTIASAEQDKRDWIAHYFPGIPMEVGPYSKHKKNWCKPLDILVDDKRSNVEEWKAAGGVAVYHIGNWPATLDNLQQAVKMDQPSILGPVAHVG